MSNENVRSIVLKRTPRPRNTTSLGSRNYLLRLAAEDVFQISLSSYDLPLCTNWFKILNKETLRLLDQNHLAGRGADSA
jgi:hypothetical protein